MSDKTYTRRYPERDTIMAIGVNAAGARRNNETATQYKQRVVDATAEMYDPRFLEDLDRIASAMPLIGIVEKVEVGEHSAEITFRKEVGKDGDDEFESAKTDYLTRPSAKAVAERAQALVGHRVRWFKVNMEDPKGKVSQGFRTIVGIVDLGPANKDTQAPAPAPAPEAAAEPQAPAPAEQETPAPALASVPEPADETQQASEPAAQDNYPTASQGNTSNAVEFAHYLMTTYSISQATLKEVASANNISAPTATAADLIRLENLIRDKCNIPPLQAQLAGVN